MNNTYGNIMSPGIGQQQQFGNNAMNYNIYAPRCEVTRVNGEAGARAFRMGPNSNALLLDNTAPIIWFVQTDGAGYLSATPYDYAPHQAKQPIDVDQLAARVAQLEELINAKQSNFKSNNKSKKQQQSISNEPTNDSTNQGFNEPNPNGF